MEFKKINTRKRRVIVQKINGTKFECKTASNEDALKYAENLKYLPEVHVHSNLRGDSRVWVKI